MVALRSPSNYYEIEFSADGHIEVQSFGPHSEVQNLLTRADSFKVHSPTPGRLPSSRCIRSALAESMRLRTVAFGALKIQH
jgi:hypothetical protein